MENIAWDEKFNIGVDVIDKAHAKLFRIMKKLIDMSEDDETNQTTYKEGIKYLEAYSMTHFSEEETYMRSVRYQGYAQHKKIHDNFRDKTLVSLKKDLELSNYSTTAVHRFVGIMNNWLAEHIMMEDQAIVGRIINRKGYDLSSQIPIISRVMNRAMTEVFQTESKFVSADYKGQNFGKALYCCYFCDTESGIRLQLLLGVEETLFFRAAKQQEAEKEMTEEEKLRVFGQLFQTISKLFRVETEYELDKDNLLTRDGFRANFMKGYPCSLLFTTKVGYFVFCYRSWRVKKQKPSADEKTV